MEQWNVPNQILEIENLISVPLHAEVSVIGPEARTLGCITQSFSAETPAEGVEGELIYGSGDQERDIKGHIVLREGFASPLPIWVAERKGAIGQIWINAGEFPHNMCISTVWGHPTPETADFLPKTPVVSMNRTNGDILKSLCLKGRVKVRMTTRVETGFKKVPLAVAEVKGVLEPDKYVLFNGHIDSWHKGASDNGGANACLLEVARVLAKYRKQLLRGVRFAWWPGHSQGRYSGSTWYADYHREDLYKNAIVHLNIDSIGCGGADDYSEVECTAEAYEFGKFIIGKYTGQEAKYERIGRSGDNSFWGIGMPTLFQLLSRQPPGKGGKGLLLPGLPWFWHTEQDTLDKIDRKNLLRDSQIYMAAVWRLCTLPVLPFTFGNVGKEFIHHLSEYQKKAGSRFDLGEAIEKANLFAAGARELDRLSGQINSAYESAEGPGNLEGDLRRGLEKVNRLMMKLSRILIPVSYSAVDNFDEDRAIPIPPLPRLAQLEDLGKMAPGDWPFKFLERKMVRERNRIILALEEAEEIMAEMIPQLRGLVETFRR
jgi:hypothetical protein